MKKENEFENSILSKLLKQIKELKEEKKNYKKLFQIESEISYHRDFVLKKAKENLYKFLFEIQKTIYESVKPLEALLKHQDQDDLIKKIKG